MKCAICKHGTTDPGFMTATFERGDTIVEIKGVPASICQICGEEYVSDQVAGKLLKQAEEAEKAGVL